MLVPKLGQLLKHDFAARWKHYFGAFDIGLSYFNGNGREPYFKFDEKNIGNYFTQVFKF